VVVNLPRRVSWEWMFIEIIPEFTGNTLGRIAASALRATGMGIEGVG